MSSEPPGYTLPVWVCAAARGAVQRLCGQPFEPQQLLWLQADGGAQTPVPVQAVAALGDGWVMGSAVCDPGPGVLDLTRGLLVWVMVRWLEPSDRERAAEGSADVRPWLQLEPGEGVGVHAATGQACLSGFAQRLLERNLRPLLPPGRRLQLRVVLPDGRRLAERTSNAAFGVVDGLALIGTQAAVQHSAAPQQLDAALTQLRSLAAQPGFGGDLVLVIGENGLDLAPQLGLPAALLVKAGNWLGPLLVAAGEAGVGRLLLFGYQGKLVKLAGGIFHTHHHLADGRAEVITALAALEGLSGEPLAALHRASTVDQGLAGLDAVDPVLAARLRRRLALTIEQRSADYLMRHGHRQPRVGAVLFDRARCICARGPLGELLYTALQSPGQGPAQEDF